MLHIIESSKKKYKEINSSSPKIVSFAPGRVNLIGEHVDYNEGCVLPIIVPLFTVIVGEQITAGTLSSFVSLNMDENEQTFSFNSQNVCKIEGKSKWVNYLLGVLHEISPITKVPTFKALINTNIPIGAGLSSSAALEVAFFKFLQQMCPDLNNISCLDAILKCQKAEQNYAGVPCGIMDHYVSWKGQDGHALFLDCQSLKSQSVKFFDADVTILIIDSKIKHNLAENEYKARKNECLMAANVLNLTSLRNANYNHLKYLESIGIDEKILKRVRHVVSEMERTKRALIFLESQNVEMFGKVMIESHHSLKNDYEVSCHEIDNIVETTLKINGVYGSRITGGGFGGCTVSLVKTKQISDVISELKTKLNCNCDFYHFTPSNDAKSVSFSTLSNF